MSPPAPSHLSYEEYLELETKSTEKHEYLCGEILAMAEGTPEHALLQVAVAAELRGLLRGKPCRVLGPDLRVRIDATNLSTYPDATVVCGDLQTAEQDQHAVTNPTFIVEVLSDSTEAFDRGEKFSHYRHLESLRGYLLVSQRRPRLELYSTDEAGRWTLSEAGPGESLSIESLGISLETDEVYRDTLESGTSSL